MSKLHFGNLSLAHIEQDPSVVYRVGNGVLPEMAEAFGFELDPEPNPKNMGEFIAVVGPNATLRDNEAGVEAVLKNAVPTAAGWVRKSGIMVPVDGGLWVPEQSTPENAALVIMPGVPRWLMRSIEVAKTAPQKDVYMAGGSRKMKSKIDLTDPNVLDFIAKEDTSPTEFEYFDRYCREALEAAGKNVIVLESEAVNSWGILPDLFKQYPELFDRNIAAVRVANAARTMGLQLRLAGRGINDSFDAQDAPQIYAISDSMRLAATVKTAANPAKYQSSVTAARQIPVLAKEFLAQKF